MRIPRSVKNLIEAFERLPGIGPKTAQRLTYYLFHVPKEEVGALAQAVGELREKTIVCSTCKNISEANLCEICADKSRDRSILCVVEEPLDILALERAGNFKGLYHVLGGRIDPLNNVGPDELYLKELMDRLGSPSPIKELILATNPNMEGEATAMYIKRLIGESGYQDIKVTRIGRGLPTGADLEYADETTLKRAMEGRSEF